MLDIAQMGLTDADTFGKLLLLEQAGTCLLYTSYIIKYNINLPYFYFIFF